MSASPPEPERIAIVATLTVREGALAQFEAFERAAAAVMARHGGAIDRTVRIAAAHPGDATREVHVVSFPSREAFDAYRADPALAELAPARAAAVAETVVLVGRDGPDYQRGC